MELVAATVTASPADPDYEDMARLFIRAANGYVVSLSRPVGAAFVEVMVRDQVTARTSELSAWLSSRRLHLSVPASVAQKLDGHAEYLVELDATATDIQSALSAIFSGVGRYECSL